MSSILDRDYNSTKEIVTMLDNVDPTTNASSLYVNALDFGEKYIKPLVDEAEDTHTFPSQLWPLLGDYGFHGITIGNDFQGMDLGYLAHFVTMQAFSRYAGGIALSYGAHSNLYVNAIYECGNAAQKEKYLPDFVSGKKHGAVAMTEPGNHSDTKKMQLRLDIVDDGLIANGDKIFITNGKTASAIILYGRSAPYDPARPSYGVTACIVDAGMKGFTPNPTLQKKGGMRSSETAQLFFEDCFIPNENILGELHFGNRIQMHNLNSERGVLSGGPQGHADAAFDIVFNHANEHGLLDIPVVRQQLTDVYMNVSASRRNAYAVLAHADKGKMSQDVKVRREYFENKDAALLKNFTTDMAVKETLNCIYLGGGMGYTEEMALMRHHADSILYNIGAGTRNICSHIAANDLFRLKK